MFDSKKYYIKNRERILKKYKEWKNSERGKILKKRNREKHREKQRERDRMRTQRKRKYIQEYKLLKGCSVCGYNKCAEALEFHHNGDKNFGIALSISRNRNLKEVKKEMDECIILCSNCHRELHVEEKENDD